MFHTIMHRRCFLGLAAAIVSVLVPLAPAQDRPQLRVLTYNIHHGQGADGKFDLERLAKIIASVKPDLVALQEVDRKTERASGVDQAAELGKLTGLHAVFGKAMDYSGGEYGEAILTRVKPDEVKTHALPHDQGTEPRAALAVRLKPGRDLPELILVGTHLCHQREANRVAQAKEINRLFPDKGGPPVLLAGDLNARAGSETMKEFGRQWTDTLPDVRTIDYVLVRTSDQWRVIETKVIDDRVASDHRPVLVVLEWRGENPPMRPPRR
ncbi:MAG: endonuclease/exonuclease/phosphatase family protein [Blastocatellia bacterium]